MQRLSVSRFAHCMICTSSSLLFAICQASNAGSTMPTELASPVCLAGAEELQFVLVLRDYDHLLTAAAPETVVKTNMSQSLVGHRMAFQVKLRNGSHTTKLVSFADGKMLAMSVLAINLGPDDDMNEKVLSLLSFTQLCSRTRGCYCDPVCLLSLRATF
jgi:hypothetical protein